MVRIWVGGDIKDRFSSVDGTGAIDRDDRQCIVVDDAPFEKHADRETGLMAGRYFSMLVYFVLDACRGRTDDACLNE